MGICGKCLWHLGFASYCYSTWFSCRRCLKQPKVCLQWINKKAIIISSILTTMKKSSSAALAWPCIILYPTEVCPCYTLHCYNETFEQLYNAVQSYSVFTSKPGLPYTQPKNNAYLEYLNAILLSDDNTRSSTWDLIDYVQWYFMPCHIIMSQMRSSFINSIIYIACVNLWFSSINHSRKEFYFSLF